MNEIIAIPYVVVTLADSREAALVEYSLSSKYYTQRSELSPHLKLAGIRVVKNNRDLLMAVADLENIVNKCTSMPCYVIEYGTMYLRRAGQDDGVEIADLFFFPADARTGDEVEVFYRPGMFPRHFGRGVLTNDGIVITYKKEV